MSLLKRAALSTLLLATSCHPPSQALSIESERHPANTHDFRLTIQQLSKNTPRTTASAKQPQVAMHAAAQEPRTIDPLLTIIGSTLAILPKIIIGCILMTYLFDWVTNNRDPLLLNKHEHQKLILNFLLSEVLPWTGRHLIFEALCVPLAVPILVQDLLTTLFIWSLQVGTMKKVGKTYTITDSYSLLAITCVGSLLLGTLIYLFCKEPTVSNKRAYQQGCAVGLFLFLATLGISKILDKYGDSSTIEEIQWQQLVPEVIIFQYIGRQVSCVFFKLYWEKPLLSLQAQLGESSFLTGYTKNIQYMIHKQEGIGAQLPLSEIYKNICLLIYKSVAKTAFNDYISDNFTTLIHALTANIVTNILIPFSWTHLLSLLPFYLVFPPMFNGVIKYTR